MFEAALRSIGGNNSEVASALRREYTDMLEYFDGSRDERRITYHEEVTMRATARAAARERLMALRVDGRIGDETFHALEAELDLIELGAEVRSRW
jgi:monovalent cation/hydrogen antiporter